MSKFPYTSEGMVRETTYEIGGLLAAVWLGENWLEAHQVEEFRELLNREFRPVVGQVDDAASDWINTQF
ncbi:hypothetical protein [Varibaculum vaginae]|uniref:hypothetical protein n=1 Tax=Varibaculum vaginae TaxID=2364797 RepID=UPI000F07FDF0|nr:hypothetical protein [Varibaculum vaginae]